MKAFEVILTYIAVKKLITFLVLAAMMIGLLAIVCVTAVFASKADISDNNDLAEVFSDNNRDKLEYTYCDSWKWENMRALDVFEGLV